MSIIEAPDAPEQTWRPPLETRSAVAFGMGVIITLPAGYVALTLWTNQVSHALWIALALGLAVWGVLAGRALAQSVTLTADTIVIRNIFTTSRVPIVNVVEVGFRRGRLRVTSQRGAFAPEHYTVESVALGSSRWSGRRTNADAVADAITDAVGLPRLPPRPEIISPRRARTLLVAAVVLFGFGAYLGPVGGIQLHHRPFVLTEVGALAWAAGAGALGFAIRLTRDHRRNRR